MHHVQRWAPSKSDPKRWGVFKCLVTQKDWPWSLLSTCKLLFCVYFQESLHSAFHAARVYSRTLEHFRHFYKDNKGLDLDLLRQQDHGRSNWGQCRSTVNVMVTLSSFTADLSFFEKSLETYSSQQRDALSIRQTTPLGLLLVDKQRFRETFESLLQSCLEVTCSRVHTLSTLLLLVKQCEDYTPPPKKIWHVQYLSAGVPKSSPRRPQKSQVFFRSYQVDIWHSAVFDEVLCLVRKKTWIATLEDWFWTPLPYWLVHLCI